MQINSLILEVILFITTPVLTQYNGIRPDVTFGDHNDRFDVSDMMSQQQKYLRAEASDDYRRSHSSKRRPKFLRTSDYVDNNWYPTLDKSKNKFMEKIKKETQKQLNRLANIILLRMNSMRRTGDYALHDDMKSDGGDIYDFNENLAVFQKVSKRSDSAENMSYRRMGTDPEMFNYAFPIDMQVKGYLVPPENQ